MKMNFHDMAKKAHGGDKEAMSLLIIEAPSGMMGAKSPEEFAEMLASDESMAEKMGGMDHFSKDSYNAYENEEKHEHSSDDYPDDHHATMKQMAAEMYKASKHHMKLADKLMEMCKEMYGDSDSKKSERSEY
tara:strand:+ start:6646 stop:7041 length:396 start_codon:yes stop_codon:yes gene_type:complete